MTSSMEKCFLLPCLLLLATSSIVQSQFNTGATTNECVSLQPAGVTPSTGNAPFIVAANASNYIPSETAIQPVQVFIAALNPVTVRGLVIQARRASGDTSPVGSFSLPASNLYRFLTCGTSTTGTLTNTDASDKSLPLLFLWAPPPVSVGNVEFIVSLAETNGNFWSRISPLNQLALGLNIAACPTPNVQGSQATWSLPNCLRGTTSLGNSATCDRQSGSTFPSGDTVVTCECQDQGEISSCTFTVTIGGDNNTPDTPTCPDPQTATAPMGSTSFPVTYGPVLCNDIEDGSFLANCLPASGFQFGIGTTAVVCSCIDSGGLVSSCSFTVTVITVTGPCVGNPCSGNECRVSSNSLAGYTCHSVTGTPCPQV